MRSIITNTLIQVSQYSGNFIGKTVWQIKVKELLATAITSFVLMGCEAPLNLEGVENELSKSVRRTDQLQAVALSQGVVTVVGSDGLVLTSASNELNWQRQVLAERPNFVDIDTCSDGSMIALSMEHSVWLSTDQGQSWNKKDIPSQESLISLTCGPDNSYWVTGSFSTLISSKDQGQSWQETTLNEDALITQVQFLSADELIATGEFGLVARSIDGGQNWSVQTPIPNEFFPLGSHFSDASTGWVAGLGGIILNTTDGGENWTTQSTPTESPLYGFYSNDNQLFAFGDHGTVLKLNGSGWERLNSPSIPVYLRDGTQISDSQLIVAGGWGSLFTVDLQQL